MQGHVRSLMTDGRNGSEGRDHRDSRGSWPRTRPGPAYPSTPPQAATSTLGVSALGDLGRPGRVAEHAFVLHRDHHAPVGQARFADLVARLLVSRSCTGLATPVLRPLCAIRTRPLTGTTPLQTRWQTCRQ
jgi:hypothetical protein